MSQLITTLPPTSQWLIHKSSFPELGTRDNWRDNLRAASRAKQLTSVTITLNAFSYFICESQKPSYMVALSHCRLLQCKKIVAHPALVSCLTIKNPHFEVLLQPIPRRKNLQNIAGFLLQVKSHETWFVKILFLFCF